VALHGLPASPPQVGVVTQRLSSVHWQPALQWLLVEQSSDVLHSPLGSKHVCVKPLHAWFPGHSWGPEQLVGGFTHNPFSQIWVSGGLTQSALVAQAPTSLRLRHTPSAHSWSSAQSVLSRQPTEQNPALLQYWP
jgi:hypothetical protein